MLAALITATDTTIDDNKVVAGWTAFWIFVALILATAFLLWNFTKQLKKTKRAAERGVFGPVDPVDPVDADAGTNVATGQTAEQTAELPTEQPTEDGSEHRATNGG